MTPKTLNRRDFLATSALAASSVALTPKSWGSVSGANSQVGIAFIGTGRQGTNLMQKFCQVPGIRLIAVCDADTAHMEKALQDKDVKFAHQLNPVRRYQDVRDCLADKDIDAVVIASPNHWHTLMTIWACQAGKDVYVEKPFSHNVWEGRKLLEAQRKYQRVVAHGTHWRSMGGIVGAMNYLHSGALGKIKLVRGLCYRNRPSIGTVDGPQPIPPTVDYELWTGPAQKEQLMRPHLHYDWHWVFNTGNGDIGNQGPHQFDLIHWSLGNPGLPKRVMSAGGRFGYTDAAETPNSQLTFFEFEDAAPVIFENRGLPLARGLDPLSQFMGTRVGHIVYCEDGYIINSIVYDNQGNKLDVVVDVENGTPYQNFIDCVRSQKHRDLNAPIEEGLGGCDMAHLGNISYRVGTLGTPFEFQESVKGDGNAMEAFGRMREHLAANGVDLFRHPMAIGPWLEIDRKKERIKKANGESSGDLVKKANELLKDPYRESFYVPEKV